jgi:hypothetical protein
LNRKRWSIFLVIFFLCAVIIPSKVLSDTNFPLTQIKVDSNSGDGFFKKIYESVYLGLSIYKLDTIEKYTKERLITSLQAGTGNGLIKFDLENIDIGKKGWTRYYPFSIGDKNFIMRIFLTEELQYQPKVKILYEGALKDPAITFQILPSLNDIMSDCRIKPFKTYSTAQADSSS